MRRESDSQGPEGSPGFGPGSVANRIAHPGVMPSVGVSGPAGIPLPTLTIVSRSAHGSTRYCIPGHRCTILGCAVIAVTRPFAPKKTVLTHPWVGLCSPRPILITGSRRPGNAS
jgi:hypothetical protein